MAACVARDVVAAILAIVVVVIGSRLGRDKVEVSSLGRAREADTFVWKATAVVLIAYGVAFMLFALSDLAYQIAG